MNATLSVRLGEKLALALEEEARQTGLSKGELARQALEARLQRTRTLVVMRQHIGAMQGPPDLSANKSYRRTWKRMLP